ncbi:hypothetical protein CEXT_637841, partial [Caerostris extrusa]
MDFKEYCGEKGEHEPPKTYWRNVNFTYELVKLHMEL